MIELVDPTLMTTAFEWRLKKRHDAVQRHFRPDDSRAEAKHIGVIVRSRKSGRGHIMACRCANLPMSVRGNTNADTGSANQNAA
jgi:hypothetical protein